MYEIMQYLEDLSDKFQDWIIDNQGNPLLWVALLAVGMGVFFMTYNALQKER